MMDAAADDALLAQAERVQASIDGAPPPGAAAPAEASPKLTLAQEIAAVAETVGAVLASFFPSVREAMPAAKCVEIGAAVAPVLQKYGLEKYVAGMAWKVEVQAVVAVAPVVLAVRAAILADLETMRRKAGEARAEPAPGAPPAAPSEPPGDKPPMLAPT